ncbi:MAG: methionine synthase [Myxococcales bacterium]|jgi:5-methyltetrahydrofolate--homocysteine methyltransferase
MTRQDRIAALTEALSARVLVVDGAMGTAIQALGLPAESYGGPQFEGCNEHLLLTRPDVIRAIHAAYLEAGADIVETNTFGATPLVLGEYGLAGKAREINVAGARIAREVADRFTTGDKPRWVAGSVGPTTRSLSVTGGISFEELVEHYLVQLAGLHEGGVDYFLVETCQDTRNIKAALVAAERLFHQGAERIPVAVSATIETSGVMLAGQSADALAVSLEHLDLLYLGLNCATGPELMADHLRSLSARTRSRVGCLPNAGLPDAEGRYLQSPESFAAALARFAREGWVNVVGGCCGTDRRHIAALAEAVRGLAPRRPPRQRRSALCGVDVVEVNEQTRPVLVGERANVLGSKRFRELIAAERFDEAAEIARAQVKKGAQVIDLSTQQADRDERADLRRLLEQVVRRVRAPLMIDSTDAATVAMALTWCQGKSIINSVNLEDGERRFEEITRLARRFGAALVVGSIDERGQAIDRRRKVEIARRSFELLTGRYGMAAEDLYFDPLVFPCASGDAAYHGSAVETIEAVREIKRALPGAKTVLGISNVSFGLPTAGRPVINSVFLHHCVEAGLDLALVNPEGTRRYPAIDPHERKLAEDVLFCRGAGASLGERLESAIAAFADYFRAHAPKAVELASLPLDERLARHVIEGTKDGLFEDLDEKLETTPALEIINGPLMRAMDEVGRLFNANQLIIAEVLQSAEVMKAAVSHLERSMERAGAARRGKVLLATVKGDVHDIGKNLVDIILSNNGFEVINLGVKVGSEKLLEAVREHRPDLIGLSGLLVKSAHQMAATAEDLDRAGIDVPLLVGGAALSRGFVDRRIARSYGGIVAYASDAMSGLELAKRLVEPGRRAALAAELAARRDRDASPPAPTHSGAAIHARRSARIAPCPQAPEPPDFERHVLEGCLDEIWAYLNPVMLYGRHLGIKSAIVRGIDAASPAELARTEAGRKALELRKAVEEMKQECRAGAMRARAVYRFFRAESEGNKVRLFEPGTGGVAAELSFQRQPGPDGLCLADFVSPAGGPPDSLCLFVTTAGEGVRERAEAFKERGDYLKSHLIQALALETAEAFAELLHSKLRAMWGFADGPELTMLDRFRASYRGRRFSFGYPACPHLEQQALLFRLLQPEELGVTLTDGCMMEPEASISALVFHHPQATYFSVLAPRSDG